MTVLNATTEVLKLIQWIKKGNRAACDAICDDLITVDYKEDLELMSNRLIEDGELEKARILIKLIDLALQRNQ